MIGTLDKEALAAEFNVDPKTVDLDRGRRAFMRTLGLGAAGAAIMGGAAPAAFAQAAGPTAADVINFALNLEYLEAEFYLRAAFGRGLADADITGSGTLGPVTGGRAVDFGSDTVIRNYARELANDEEAHVRVLRGILGPQRRVARPAINLVDSFNALGRFSGLVPQPNGTFDAFGSVTNFILASFVFEDVGVTAYLGGLPFLLTNEFVGTVAGIALAEAYHAGVIRAVINGRGLFQQANAISNLRDFFDGPTDLDQGAGNPDVSNILPANEAAVPFARTPAQVLAIVYGSGATETRGPLPGGFLPNGANGTIR